MLGLRSRWYLGRINKALAAHRRLLERVEHAELEGSRPANSRPITDEVLYDVVRLEHRLERLRDEGDHLAQLGLIDRRMREMLGTLQVAISSWHDVEEALRTRHRQHHAA